MKNLKKLGAAVVLTCIFSLTTFADDPCAPPQPGQIPTPPCSIAQTTATDETDLTITLGQIETPSAASFAEIANSVLFGILTLF